MIRPAIVARRIGNERQPIAIVDGFHPEPSALHKIAASRAFVQAERHYPGVRAALPDDYMFAIQPVMATVLREVFACHGGLALLDASFSMVTTPPAALSIAQRLPHVDAVQPERIALVHFLTDGDGTAFFRHRSTSFETITEARAARYYQRLNEELRQFGSPAPSYIRESGPLFERIALVAARFNRAVIYRSALLHSGAISPDALLTDDQTQGRLTVTAFLETT